VLFSSDVFLHAPPVNTIFRCGLPNLGWNGQGYFVGMAAVLFFFSKKYRITFRYGFFSHGIVSLEAFFMRTYSGTTGSSPGE